MRSSHLLTALASAALLTVAGPAGADPFGNYNAGGDGTGAIADNFQHTYCYSTGWTSSWDTYATYAMHNLDDQTEYYDISYSSCTAATDIYWQLDSTMAYRGHYVCNAWMWAGYCDQATIRLSPTYLTDDQNRKKTACHEIGHSVGLQHSSTQTDCMINGSVGSGSQWITYNAHHISHANSRTPSAS